MTFGIRWKVMAGMAGLAVVSVVLASVPIIIGSTGTLERQVRTLAVESAKQYSEHIVRTMDLASTVARSLSADLSVMKVSGLANRAAGDLLLRQTLKDNAELFAAFTLWEPNAYDGRDGDFVNKPGHDATGRYLPYWHRGKDGQVNVEPLTLYEDPNGPYLTLKANPHTDIIDPYEYKVEGKSILMTTATEPIMIDGRFMGVVGVDISLDTMLHEIAALKPLGTGNAWLVAANGTFSADQDAELLGKDFSASGMDKALLERAKRDGSAWNVRSSPQGGLYLDVSVPVVFGRGAGQWMFGISVPMATILAPRDVLIHQTVLLCILVLAAAVLTGFLLARGIVKPLLALEGSMRSLANGDLTSAIPHSKRDDEIGRMTKAVVYFKERALEAAHLREEQSRAQSAADAERRKVMNDLGDRFEHDVQTVVEVLSGAGETMCDRAQSMNLVFSATVKRTEATVDGVELSSQGARSVAAAAEELAASIKDVASRVASAAAVLDQASERARQTEVTIDRLFRAVREIGDVADLIRSISSMTNLLSLNATIEASRAGDAGKGFAVVANEVKALALQTNHATQQITERIQGIDHETDVAVKAVRDVVDVLGQIADISRGLSDSMDQQSLATQEIAQNIDLVSTNVRAVHGNVETVFQEIGGAQAMADAVLELAIEVSGQTETLAGQVRNFLGGIRG